MPRIRTLRPEMLSDERLATLPDSAWRLFVSMMMLADDGGRVTGNPRVLRAQALPLASPRKAAAVQHDLAVLEDAGLVLLYAATDGRALAEIRSWTAQDSSWGQRIDHPSRSRLPAPESREPSRGFASPREPSRGFASPREPSRALVTDRDLDLERDPEEERLVGRRGAPRGDRAGVDAPPLGDDCPPPPDTGLEPEPAPPPPPSADPEAEPPPGLDETDPPQTTAAVSGSNGTGRAPANRAADVQRVFDHWRAKLGHPSAKLTPKRRRLVEARLRDGYSAEDLMRAIDGCAASEFHRGDNASGTVYDNLELICRDGGKVEQFRDRLVRPATPHRPDEPRERKYPIVR